MTNDALSESELELLDKAALAVLPLACQLSMSAPGPAIVGAKQQGVNLDVAGACMLALEVGGAYVTYRRAMLARAQAAAEQASQPPLPFAKVG